MISGIIYAILDDGYFYIGSTTQSILERMGLHISASKGKSKNSKFYKYINEVRKGWEDIIYITLEEVECEHDTELRNKEYEYIKKNIKDPYCLNVLQSDKQKYSINNAIKKRFNK